MARAIGPVCPGFRVGARLGATLVAALLALAAGSLAPEGAVVTTSMPIRPMGTWTEGCVPDSSR